MTAPGKLSCRLLAHVVRQFAFAVMRGRSPAGLITVPRGF